MTLLKTTLAGAAALALLYAVPAAKADAWDQKTVFTFPSAVEVPGRVLPAGEYVFKLANSPANRQIVQIFTQDEKQIIGTFLTIPDYRLKPVSHTTISFDERAGGAPEAVRSWFYPGKNYGHQFLYRKTKPVETAQLNLEVRLPDPPVNDVKIEPVVEAPAPTAVAVPTAPAKLEAPAPVQETATTDEAVVNEETPAPIAEELPETGSSTPLAGILGLFSLAAAGVLRRVSTRVEQ
jgi:LPXTG-motif cell wall-anchored protein